MYKPIKLTGKDFQSFAEIDLDLSSNKAVIIEGDNQTDEGQETNGSGKSTILEMLHYALLGSSSNGKRDAKLIRWGQKEAIVILTLKNNYLNEELTIERHLFSGTKSATLSISINGQEQKNRFSSVAEGNKWILDMLDISSEDLKNYFLINRKRFVSFFDSPDSAKRSLLGRFSNADRIQKVSDKIDELLKDTQNQINDKQKEEIALTSKIDLLTQQIEEEKKKDQYEEKKKEIEEKISSCKARLETLDKDLREMDRELFNNQTAITKANEDLASLNKELKDMESIDFSAKLQENSKEQSILQNKIDACKKEKTDLLDEISSLKSELQPILNSLMGVVTCPNCKTEFVVGDADFDVKEGQSLVNDVQKMVDELTESVKKKEQEIIQREQSVEMKQLKMERQKILIDSEANAKRIESFKRDKIQPANNDLLKYQRLKIILTEDKTRSLVEQATQEKTLKELENALSNLSHDVVSTDLAKWEKQKAEFEKKRDALKSDILKLERNNQRDRQWKERINQFYVYVTNQTLTLIQSHCNYYLEKIDSDLRLKFEGFKQLSDGKIKESINAVIQRNGEEESDYRCFSGGEQARMVLSTILTYQDFINQKSKSGGLSLLVVDEILDQMDSMGLTNLVKCLNNMSLNSSIYLISQVNIEGEGQKLKVVKKDGISFIAV